MARTIKWQRTGGKTQRVTVTEDYAVTDDVWYAQYRSEMNVEIGLGAILGANVGRWLGF